MIRTLQHTMIYSLMIGQLPLILSSHMSKINFRVNLAQDVHPWFKMLINTMWNYYLLHGIPWIWSIIWYTANKGNGNLASSWSWYKHSNINRDNQDINQMRVGLGVVTQASNCVISPSWARQTHLAICQLDLHSVTIVNAFKLQNDKEKNVNLNSFHVGPKSGPANTMETALSIQP